jgi:hypothetical protein
MAAVPPSESDESAVLFVDREALLAVVEALEGVVDVKSFALEAPPGKAGSPLVLLRLLPIDVGPLRVRVQGDELGLIGDAASFRELADELAEFVAENDLDEPGMHTHIDLVWKPPPPWIAEESLPLVIAGWFPDGA